jgi:hypothetical protein
MYLYTRTRIPPSMSRHKLLHPQAEVSGASSIHNSSIDSLGATVCSYRRKQQFGLGFLGLQEGAQESTSELPNVRRYGAFC